MQDDVMNTKTVDSYALDIFSDNNSVFWRVTDTYWTLYSTLIERVHDYNICMLS